MATKAVVIPGIGTEARTFSRTGKGYKKVRQYHYRKAARAAFLLMAKQCGLTPLIKVQVAEGRSSELFAIDLSKAGLSIPENFQAMKPGENSTVQQGVCWEVRLSSLMVKRCLLPRHAYLNGSCNEWIVTGRDFAIFLLSNGFKYDYPRDPTFDQPGIFD